MNARHQQFINEYFLCGLNATEAYRRVYPKSSYEAARRDASRLLTNADISAEIKNRIAESVMSADEVLIRLAEHGRGDIGEFINLSPEEIKASGRSHLIKKFTKTKTTTTRTSAKSDSVTVIDSESFTVEMYDALAAKNLIGRHHKLFTDNVDVKTDGKPIPAIVVQSDYFDAI